MIKPVLALFAAVSMAATSYHVSTSVGLRFSGEHEVVIDLPGKPRHPPVGDNLFTPDGSRLLVTGISGFGGGEHQVHTKVSGTHRYALAMFPARIIHSFEMDLPAVEWTVMRATGAAARPFPRDQGRQWHLLD